MEEAEIRQREVTGVEKASKAKVERARVKAARAKEARAHREAGSTLYYPYMPSVVPPRARDQIALRRPAAPPEQPAST